MTEAIRAIRPMPDLLPADLGELDLGATPELRWVAPTSLFVDEAYQRGLTKRSRRLIAGIVKNFSWRKFKPPIVVDTQQGLHCIDGQHGAIGAATLKIPAIPVFLIGEATLTERADSFVAHNRDRVAMSPMDIYRAKIAAQDPDALDVVRVCQRAGVNLKIINQNARVDIGDTAAVATIQRLVKRQGPQKARMVLEALVKGGRAPIGAAEIDAAEAAMLLVRPATTVNEMAAAVAAVSDHGVAEAKMIAASDGKPHKQILFDAYMRILEKQTGIRRVAS